MYSATFVFDTRQLGSEFHRPDTLIAAAKEAMDVSARKPGEIRNPGVSQTSIAGGSERGLKQLIAHPTHLAARRRQSEWLSGCEVMAQRIRADGDKTIAHPTARA